MMIHASQGTVATLVPVSHFHADEIDNHTRRTEAPQGNNVIREKKGLVACSFQRRVCISFVAIFESAILRPGPARTAWRKQPTFPCGPG
jgi:hypothetical protein